MYHSIPNPIDTPNLKIFGKIKSNATTLNTNSWWVEKEACNTIVDNLDLIKSLYIRLLYNKHSQIHTNARRKSKG